MPQGINTLDALTWLFSAIAVVLLALPFLRYLTVGWHEKLEMILDDFDPPAIMLYFRKYRTSERTSGRNGRPFRALRAGVDDETLLSEFLRLYNREFGRGVYLVPFTLLLLATLIEAVATIQSG